jgi:hypothetical protein
MAWASSIGGSNVAKVGKPWLFRSDTKLCYFCTHQFYAAGSSNQNSLLSEVDLSLQVLLMKSL